MEPSQIEITTILAAAFMFRSAKAFGEISQESQALLEGLAAGFWNKREEFMNTCARAAVQLDNLQTLRETVEKATREVEEEVADVRA